MKTNKLVDREQLRFSLEAIFSFSINAGYPLREIFMARFHEVFNKQNIFISQQTPLNQIAPADAHQA